LPDGSQGYYQLTEPNGDAVVVVYARVPAKDLKQEKEPK
jgi:hypothetical protein